MSISNRSLFMGLSLRGQALSECEALSLILALSYQILARPDPILF